MSIKFKAYKFRIDYAFSDLHMYEGRTAAEAGIVFGHEKYVSLLKWHEEIPLTW